MITKTPQVDDQYVMCCENPLALSHRELPLWLEVKVIALDNENIWYRVESGIIARKTTLDLFQKTVFEHKPQTPKTLDKPKSLRFWRRKS